MLIQFRDLLFKYKRIPKGIIHIGAHVGEEAVQYDDCGIDKVIWIEGSPKTFELLKENIKKYPKHIAYNNLISDKDDDVIDFHITNNNESSSILEMGVHSIHHPNIIVTETIQRKTITLNTLFDREKINIDEYNFINIDLQGAELMALKGFDKYLNKIDMIYSEVNSNHLYKNCALIGDLDEYLSYFGFERVETKMTESEWGDAYYLKK